MNITKTCPTCKQTLPCTLKYFHKTNKGLSKKCKQCTENKRKNSALKKTYNINLNQYKRLHFKQNGLCKICGQPETVKANNGKIKPLCVDHDHDTGIVRGLLCSRCNIGLGLFRDNTLMLISASKYIQTHKQIWGI